MVALAVVASGCTQFTVRADRNPDADFARYRTFAWMPIAMAPPADQDMGGRSITDRVYSDVETVLQHRGYTPAPSTSADLLITFRLLRTEGYDESYVPYSAAWYRGAYRDALHASADSYTRGTLIIDAVDRAENSLVWRGSASARLLSQPSYERQADRAQDAVAKILASFPSR